MATKILFEAGIEKENGVRNPRAFGVKVLDANKYKYRAVHSHPKYPLETPEGTKFGDIYSIWDKKNRDFVENCPVDPLNSFNYEESDRWFIPPFTESEAKQLDRDSEVFTAKREVILSAGTLSSAQLLLLSGIGPEQQLTRLGIPVLRNLPVGERLLDHEEVSMIFEMKNKKSRPWNPLTDTLSAANAWARGQGEATPLASNHAPAGMDVSSDGPFGSQHTLHIHFLQMYFENLDMFMWKDLSLGRRLPLKAREFFTYGGTDFFTFLIERSGTCSEGHLMLRSANPLDPPFVDPAYGSCDLTLREMTWAIREMRKLNSLLPDEFKGEEVFPGKNVQTDSQIRQFLRNFLWGHHLSGSCPMSACRDPRGVLDNKGRVWSVDGLRVADASVFPAIPGGNIATPTYMVAEKIVAEAIEEHSGIEA